MKRSAENQLTKDRDAGDDEDEIQEVDGFKKANDAILATRQVRSMPRRSIAATGMTASTNGASTAKEPPSTPRFSGFGGLSAASSPAPSSNSFSFTPPPAQSSTTFGSPAVSNSASNATKTFASFLSSSGTPLTPAAASTPKPTPTSVSSSNPPDSDPEVAYYTSLRGLNLSFLTAITTAVSQDPFVDIESVMKRYSDLRLDVQKEFDSSKSRMVPAKPAAAMPAPPPAFSGFGAPKTGTSASAFPSTSIPTAGGPAPPTKPLSFGSSPAFPGFGTPPAVTSSTGGNPTPSFFGFGKPASNEETNKPKDEVKQEEQSTASRSPFSATSNPFGGSSSPADIKPSSGFFGSGSASPFGAPSTSSSFSGFAKKSSFGSPVGFGFGSGSGTVSSAIDKPTESLTEAAAAKTNDEVAEKTEGEAATTEEGSNLLLGHNPHDEEGEGEEDEETTHSVRLKAFKMRPDKDGKQGWGELGHGILRLKKHKTEGKRRMLLRNSSTGKIIINFNLYEKLQPSVRQKSVSFVGHDETGGSQMLTLRLSSVDDANELKAAIEREVNLMSSKA